jgi:CBS domain-containing protein
MLIDPKRRIVRVRDVMTAAAITLSPHQTLEEASKVLARERISGAPVVENRKVVGIFTRADLIERLPSIAHSPAVRVSDAMTRSIVTAHLNETAMTAVHLMVKHRIHRVVVVDGSDKPVGIVTSLDILNALARGDPVQFGDPAFEEQAERHPEPAAALPTQIDRA